MQHSCSGVLGRALQCSASQPQPLLPWLAARAGHPGLRLARSSWQRTPLGWSPVCRHGTEVEHPRRPQCHTLTKRPVSLHAVEHERGHGGQSDADDDAGGAEGIVPLAAPHKEFVHPMPAGQRYYAVGMFCVVAALLYADQNLMAPNLTQMADEFGFNDTVSRLCPVLSWCRSTEPPGAQRRWPTSLAPTTR